MTIQTLQLSAHFSLAELTKTSRNVDNTPSIEEIDSLRQLCVNVLEKVREQFGRPVLIHSGYRNRVLNTAIGGSVTSQHMKGEAADFHVNDFTVYQVATWISEDLDYDQLILENFVPKVKSSGWVHCSFSRNNRNQDLTKFKGDKKYYAGILLIPG